MPALICGSLAFDTITTFPGRFADQILPEQVHILNVSFLVPTLRREFGGCAGNIAYTLNRLGGEPLVLAALGSDGGEYLQRLQSWGVSTEHIASIGNSFTAQAIIITDSRLSLLLRIYHIIQSVPPITPPQQQHSPAIIPFNNSRHRRDRHYHNNVHYDWSCYPKR